MKKLERLSPLKINLNESAPAEPKQINESAQNAVQFWVVTGTTPTSTFDDICYKSNPFSFAREMQGGLAEGMVAGIFPLEKEKDAKDLADKLLKNKKKATSRYDY